MSDRLMGQNRNSKAVLSAVLGVAAVAVIPFLSLLFAPCGFPTALLVGIAAIVSGRRAHREIAVGGEGGVSLAQTGILCGWIGLGLNTVIMLFKLSLFILMFILPILALLQGSQTQ
jgi:apolipoprotein N-acyltransferase